MLGLIDLPITDPVVQFAALVVVAFGVQLTFERLHLPGLTGLIIAGMLLGPGGTGVLPHGDVIELLGSVGLVYLMFMAGLEVDLGIVRTHRRETITFGLLAFALSMIPAAMVGWMLGFELRGALLLGAVISSHTLVAYPVLVRFGLLQRRPVVAAIGGTLITDTLALVALAVLLQAHGLGETENGGAEGVGGGGLIWAVPLVLLAALTAAALWLVPRLSRRLFARPGASQAEKALFVLAVLLVLSSLAELIGTKDILGAFLAGLCLNRVLAKREVLREHVEFAGRMLFIPFFFVFTGMLLELDVFGDARVWMLSALLLLIVVLGKGGAAWISGWRFGYGLRDRTMIAGLTVPQAAATLAVTMAAREAELFPEHVVDAVIVLIFLTCMAGPLLVRAIAKSQTGA